MNASKGRTTSWPMENQKYHINYLNSELERRLKRNPRYSLRSFAQDLSITSSWLSEVLSGKKGMSINKAQTLCFELGLSSVESKLFQLSVQACHARRKQDRTQAQEQLRDYKIGKSALKKINADEFQGISDWYYNALLELTELEECEHTEEWFSQKLNLPLRLVSAALKRLIAQEFIKYENGKYVATHVESATTFDIPSENIKKYHRQVMEIASRALQEQSVQQRDFANMTLAFDSDRIAEAQRYLRKFQQDFAKEFYPKKNKNSVYQLSIHFFRLDRKALK